MRSIENKSGYIIDTTVREVTLRGKVIRFPFPGQRIRKNPDAHGEWINAEDFMTIKTEAEHIELEEQRRERRERESSITKSVKLELQETVRRDIEPQNSFTSEEFGK